MISNVRKKEVTAKRFPFYVVKRMDFPKWKYWLIRGGGIILAFLVAGFTCAMLKPGSFGIFFKELIRGCFDFSDISTLIDLLTTFSIILLISIVITPAFKMKFWNIGAEGQILVGALVAAGIAKFASRDIPNIVVLLMCMIAAQAASTIWAAIPAIFKAFFNTNETLFTLMLNYIATLLSSMMISIWIKSGSQSFGMLTHGVFPKIMGSSSFLVIIFAVVIFIGMFFYINKGKHGYELSIIGESVDTARYVGINIRYVTIRSMLVAGVLFGTIGFFIVCGVNRSFSPTIVGGEGFTGVLISWLGHFDPLQIALFAFLQSIMKQGTATVATAVNISSTQFSAICTGIFFFIIIACEFFSSYKIKMHHENKEVQQ